jgi:hypothetical protein
MVAVPDQGPLLGINHPQMQFLELPGRAAQKLIAPRLDETRAKSLIADGIKNLGDKLN